MLDFVFSVMSDLSVEQQSSVAAGIAAFDFATFDTNDFAGAFSAISFAADETLNAQIQQLSADSRFASIDMAIGVMSSFVTADVDIAMLNDLDFSTTLTAEFWESTVEDIDSGIILSMVESSGVE